MLAARERDFRNSMAATATYYLVFCGVCITVLKEFNVIVDEPYMVCYSEPEPSIQTDLLAKSRTNRSMSRKHKLIAVESSRHGTLKLLPHLDCEFLETIPMNPAYNSMKYIRYIMSLLFKRVFMFKCTLPMLRLTTVLVLMSLPLILTHLLCFHKRIRPPTSILAPTVEALILGAFPIAWFFGFLYYTEVPSLMFVIWTVVAAADDRHWLAALVCPPDLPEERG